MPNPRELLQRAAENRRRRREEPAPKNEGLITRETALQQDIPDLQLRPARRPPGGHSAYSALMRSHDRVRPRIGR